MKLKKQQKTQKNSRFQQSNRQQHNLQSSPTAATLKLDTPKNSVKLGTPKNVNNKTLTFNKNVHINNFDMQKAGIAAKPTQDNNMFEIPPLISINQINDRVQNDQNQQNDPYFRSKQHERNWHQQIHRQGIHDKNRHGLGAGTLVNINSPTISSKNKHAINNNVSDPNGKRIYINPHNSSSRHIFNTKQRYQYPHGANKSNSPKQQSKTKQMYQPNTNYINSYYSNSHSRNRNNVVGEPNTKHNKMQMPHPDKEHSIAESVYLDLQQYSSIHKYESIFPYYDEFDQGREYMQLLNNNQEDQHLPNNQPTPYNHPLSKLNSQSNYVENQESITKKNGNMANRYKPNRHIQGITKNIPRLAIHTMLSNLDQKTMVVVDPNDTIHQLDGQEFTTNQHSNKIKRAQSSINPSTDSPVNALKVGHSQDQGNNNESSPSQNKVVAKYPLVAKFLSIQPSIIQQAQSQTIIYNGNGQNEHKGEKDELQDINRVHKYSAEFNRIEQQLEQIKQDNPIENKQTSRDNLSLMHELTMQIYHMFFPTSDSVPNKQMINIVQSSSIPAQYNTDKPTNINNQILNKQVSVAISSVLKQPYSNMGANNASVLSVAHQDWWANKSTPNVLRVILTKESKLVQYLKYLAQLQIKVKSQNFNKCLIKIKNRQDTTNATQNKSQNKTEQKKQQPSEVQLGKNLNRRLLLKQESKRSLLKYTQSQTAQLPDRQRQHKNRFSSTYANRSPKNTKQRLEESGISGYSDYVSNFNVFNVGNTHHSSHQNFNHVNEQGIINRQTQRSNYYNYGNSKNHRARESKLQQIQSQFDMQQVNNQETNNNRNLQGTKSKYFRSSKSKEKSKKKVLSLQSRELEVLQILQTLLTKLSDKKCNVFVKENRNSSYGAHNRNYAQLKEQEIDIQFEQYLQNNPNYKSMSQERGKGGYETSQTKLTTYSQRIRQLGRVLEDRQKYMEEIKSQYDYVIDNYVNTIVNINNMSLESSKNSKSPSRRSSVKTPIVNFNTAKSNINQLVSRNKAGNQYDRPVQHQQQEDQQQQQQEQEQRQEQGQQQEQQQQWRQKKKEIFKQTNSQQQEVDGGEKLKNRKEQYLGQQLATLRESKPITFQMSRKGNNDSVEQQQQWIGNPNKINKNGSSKVDNLQKYLNSFRHSTPLTNQPTQHHNNPNKY